MNLEGQHLGEFEILERIGQGGMGAVYKARQSSLRRTVALKTLQASLADDVEYIARFEQEAVAAAGLSHPNLVQVYSAGETDGLHWFAMEYIEGESAKARLKRKGRLDPLEAIAIAIHVATALEYGWRKAALIHRDIKPDNIFLSSDGEVKLGDLGLAKSAGQTHGLTMTGASMGTPHYISPEQVEAMKDVDLRADIYSLGCTLYHLLSGRAPFEGNSAVAIMMKHVNATAPDLRSAWPESPTELAMVVLKMMQKHPADRQQSYGEVNADLRRAYDFASGASVPSVIAVTQKPAAGEKKRAVPVIAWLVYGIALIAAIAALIHFAPWKKTNPVPPRGALEPGAIKLWDSPEKLSGSQTARWEDGAMRLDGGSPRVEIEGRDGILRARIKRNKDAVATQISLRVQNGSYYRLTLQFTNAELFAIIKGAPTLLAHWPLPREFAPDEWPMLEFKAVGNELSATIDGSPLGSVRDDSISEAGSVALFATRAGYFRDVVYVPLDKASLPNVSHAATGAAKSEITAWNPLLSQEEWQASRNDKSKLSGGVLHVTAGAMTSKPPPSSDCASRVEIIVREGSKDASLVMRETPSGGVYMLNANLVSRAFCLEFLNRDSSEQVMLGRYQLVNPVRAGDSLLMELRAEEDHLQAIVNGNTVIHAQNNRLKGLENWGMAANDAWFRSVKVQTPGISASSLESLIWHFRDLIILR